MALGLAVLALGSPAWGGPAVAEPDAAAEAERHRLLQELGALARKNAWSGVGRVYGKLERLATPEAPLPADAVVLGAQAALTEGDAALALRRLQGAVEQGATGEGRQVVAELLADVEARYGAVRVTVYTPKVPRLERPSMPFAVDERAAIDHARRRISRDRRFLGLLPAGRYTLGDVEFEVVPRAPIADVRIGVPPQSGSSFHDP